MTITGQQIKSARNRAGLTQQELATHLGVTLRTVGNWERGATVPRDKAPRIQEVLGAYIANPENIVEPGLSQATDAEILAEVAKRFSRTELPAIREPLTHNDLEARRQRIIDQAQPVTQAAGTTSRRRLDPDPESQDDGTMEPS